MRTLYIVLLIVVLFGLGNYYYRQYMNYLEEQDKKTWPEYIAPCPDYYIHEGNNKCRDVKNISKGKCNRLDFGIKIYGGADGNLNKCRKAKECGISWEGIDRICA